MKYVCFLFNTNPVLADISLDMIANIQQKDKSRACVMYHFFL